MQGRIHDPAFTELLAEADHIDNAARNLIHHVGDLWEVETVHLFSLAGNDLIPLALKGTIPVQNTIMLARLCVDRLKMESANGLAAAPLSLNGAIVGALVFSAPAGKEPAAFNSYCNLAALIVLASGGRGSRIHNPIQFLSMINQERNRSSRSQRSFAVISIAMAENQPFPQTAVQHLCRWIRSFDEVGFLNRGQVGVLLPLTETVGARIAAYRLRDLFRTELRLPTRIRFLVFSPENLKGFGTGLGENENLLDLEEHLWTSVPAVC